MREMQECLLSQPSWQISGRKEPIYRGNDAQEGTRVASPLSHDRPGLNTKKLSLLERLSDS